MSDPKIDLVPSVAADVQGKSSVWVVHSGRLPRYLGLAALLAGGLLVGALYYRECLEAVTVAVNGDVSRVTTCAPATLTSGPLLIFLLLVVALLWPDLAEVTVLGVNMKRQVEAAKAAVEAAEERVGLLEQSIQVQNLRIQTLTTATAANYTVLSFDGRFLNAERAQEIRELASEASENEAPELTSPTDLAEVTDEALKLQVLAKWESLVSLLDLDRWKRRRRDPLEQPMPLDAPPTQLQIDEFIEDHERSIQLIRNLRNSVAHARPIDRSTLISGTRLLDDLIWSAEHQLSNEEDQ